MTQTASEETLSSIGNTPLVKLDSLSGSAGDFYAKLEGHNPFGSVKDRAAYWMIKDGEERGKLVSGKSIIIEPTSGNTGIALTGIANILGYKVEIVIPEKASQETKDIIKNLGAKVFETSDDLCPKVGAGTDQSIALATSIASSRPDSESSFTSGVFPILESVSSDAVCVIYFTFLIENSITPFWLSYHLFFPRRAVHDRF